MHAAPGLDERADLLVERVVADPVARAQRHVREGQAGGDRVVELRDAAERIPHEVPGVDGEHDLVVALGAELLRDERPVARRRLPVDRPVVETGVYSRRDSNSDPSPTCFTTFSPMYVSRRRASRIASSRAARTLGTTAIVPPRSAGSRSWRRGPRGPASGATRVRRSASPGDAAREDTSTSGIVGTTAVSGGRGRTWPRTSSSTSTRVGRRQPAASRRTRMASRSPM